MKNSRTSPSKRTSPTKRRNKIEHEIENDGCRCPLCTRLTLQKMQSLKKEVPPEIHQVKQENMAKNLSEPYYIEFLMHYYQHDRFKKRFRLAIPETCLFEKGFPVCMLSKKRESHPIKIEKKREKLNFYEVKNFFLQGFLYHNQNLDRGQASSKPTRYSTKEKELVGGECIAVGRFTNNPGQLLSFSMLDALFKSNQRQYRSNLIYMQTIVGATEYEQVRSRVDIEKMRTKPEYQRAKNEVRLINSDLKHGELGFMSQFQEIEWEEQLKKQNRKNYLSYLALKFMLMHSYTSEKCIAEATFKFVKASISNGFYFVDLQVHRFCDREDIWGMQIVEQKIPLQPANRIPTNESYATGRSLRRREMSRDSGKSHISQGRYLKPIERQVTEGSEYKPSKLLRRQTQTECSADVDNLENLIPVQDVNLLKLLRRMTSGQTKGQLQDLKLY